MKNRFIALCVAVVLSVLVLCSCGVKTVTGTSWQSEEDFFVINLEFKEDGTMTMTPTLIDKKSGEKLGVTDETLKEKEQKFFYTDNKGVKGARYIKLYKTKEDFEADKNSDFMPYYIEKNVLKLNDVEYSLKK